ncbi:MAG: tRNA (uridine(34)/cytosine(34)/5-carboxymethylaminomethyluridine(34)-2'-O)-methyltransferase TrmL [Bacillota bacterium]
MHVVLVEPEIPQNTGNIARTCAATGTTLHLVEPLGFTVDDRHLKRAGLDYWHLVNVQYYKCFAELQEKYPQAIFHLSTTKGNRSYIDVDYGRDDFLVFGKETRGLSPEIMATYPDQWIRIPMVNDARSLNIGNAVAIMLYEALRQQGFPLLSK